MKVSWLLVSVLHCVAGMRLGPDGRYRGVTVKISDDIPDTNCPTILSNLKVGTLIIPN